MKASGSTLTREIKVKYKILGPGENVRIKTFS